MSTEGLKGEGGSGSEASPGVPPTAEEMLGLLRRIEWHTVYRYRDAETECPECEWDIPKHDDGCVLARAIAHYEKSEGPAKPEKGGGDERGK